MTRTGAAWDLESFSCTACHPNQPCIVSQWISTWINTEASEASGKTAVIVTQPMAFSGGGIDPHEILSFFFLAVIPPSQWKLPGEMVEFRSGEGHRPASQPEGGFHGACLSASWCLSLSCVRPPLVTRYLFSHVMRHVGACLQSLYLLSLLKTRTRCIYLLRQSPLSNGSLREEGQHPPICPQICGQTCLPWICLWPPTVIFTINKDPYETQGAVSWQWKYS